VLFFSIFSLGCSEFVGQYQCSKTGVRRELLCEEWHVKLCSLTDFTRQEVHQGCDIIAL